MPSDHPSDPPATPLQGKVLYIEDAPVNVAVVEAMLGRYPGVTLVHAATGLDGVRLVRSERPDFVLLDMHLPDISGLEVVRLLSKDIAERRLPVTILTADKLTIDVIKALSLGAGEYLVKPVSAATLEASLQRALAGKAGSRAERSGPG
jgi:CheY-like chemotaxis protein